MIEAVNPYERRAQEDRARQLADAYWERAIRVCRMLDRFTNAPVRDEAECADDVLSMVHDATVGTWMNLAVTGKLRSLPSRTTMGLAQAKVVERARTVKGGRT